MHLAPLCTNNKPLICTSINSASNGLLYSHASGRFSREKYWQCSRDLHHSRFTLSVLSGSAIKWHLIKKDSKIGHIILRALSRRRKRENSDWIASFRACQNSWKKHILASIRERSYLGTILRSGNSAAYPFAWLSNRAKKSSKCPPESMYVAPLDNHAYSRIVTAAKTISLENFYKSIKYIVLQ